MAGFFKKVFGVFSEDLGIDLGTSNTLICVKNKGIILNEPSVVVMNNKNKEIYEVGERAKMMLGKTPAMYKVIKPLRNGVIADYEVTEKMLRSFYSRVNAKSILNKPRVVICVPAGVNPVEKRAVIDVTIEAGAREAYIIEEPMAAAIGVGVNIFEPEGTMIVDIGGGTSELAVISLNGLVEKSSFKVAGDKFDAAIIDYMRLKHNLEIGEKTAEDIKISIGTLVPLEEELSIDVSGKNILNGLPKDVTVYSSELIEVLSEKVKEIIEEIKIIFEKVPSEISSDIKRRGIYVTGGGALLRGIDQKIKSSLNIDVIIAEDPLNSVINGINIMLSNFNVYKKVTTDAVESY